MDEDAALTDRRAGERS